MIYSSQEFGTYLAPSHGPVRSNGKLWVYEVCGDGDLTQLNTARAWSFTGPATAGDMPGAWVLRAASPETGDGYSQGGGNRISGSTYVDPTTGKCWATTCIHNNPSGDNGGDPRNPYGSSPGNSTGVNDVFHGVINIFSFDPEFPLTGWTELGPGIHEHNIVFEDAFDYTAECFAHTVSCPANTFSPGDILWYRTTPSLVAVTQPAICYKVSGDIVTFFVTDNTVTEYGGDLPPALSNDGVIYLTITDATPSRNWMLIQVPGNNFSPGDLVRIQTSSGYLAQYDFNYYGGWSEVEEVFASQYVSLFPNNKQLNRTDPSSRNPVSSGSPDVIGVSTGTIARYSDTGPGLYFVDAVSGPELTNTCDGPPPHAITSGQLANLGYTYFARAVPRPNGDIVVVFMGEGGLTFATLNNSWADSTVIGDNDENGLPLFGIIDSYPDSLGGVYVLTGTGTPASISTQLSNFFCIYIDADNTFSTTRLPISTYVQNDPTNLAGGDLSAAGDPCLGFAPIAPIECSAIGNMLVAEGNVFISVRWVDKTACLLVTPEGDNTWTTARETVPNYLGAPIGTNYITSPVTVQYINDPANVAAGKGGIYVVFMRYASSSGSSTYPTYLYAIRTGVNEYTVVVNQFTDIKSSAFANHYGQIFMGWDLTSTVEIFQPYGLNPSYTFEYAPDIPPPPVLSCDCNSPAGAKLRVFYTHTFAASDGTPPYSWSITSGSLPTGLPLDSTLGSVSGTPSQVGSFSFTLQVTDSLGATASVSCSITVTVSFVGLPCGSYSPPVF